VPNHDISFFKKNMGLSITEFYGADIMNR